MRMVISCVASYEDAFRRALGAKRSAEAKKELSAKKRTLQKSENRLAELDRLFKRIYEDMVNGKLSEARFQMLSDAIAGPIKAYRGVISPTASTRLWGYAA